MRIFLSALENNVDSTFNYLDQKGKKIKSGLISYFYLEKNQKSRPNLLEDIQMRCDELLVDSGAHSFQSGARVSWLEYTKRYAEWIKKVDCDQIIGFFEMDVDNVIGYEKVLELRKILDQATDKIIPVWHKNRGISEFKKMVKETKGDIIAVAGFQNEDISDDQFNKFVNYAHHRGKKVHALGMTRQKVLRKVPFDYVDSSSWKQGAIYGNALTYQGGRIKTKNVSGRFDTKELMTIGLEAYMQLADYYNAMWDHVNHDLYKIWQFVISCLTQKTKVVF
ncbi:hypothetical protein OXT66_03200 [Lentilactobacillus senioris]|uniref:hypothetical protein n=1 Tax=Lentilactobacillus senioris TaxID=931534 RepID=UPI0022804D72|nr:hypothetical protein [Lentilactobacillus senioris]MCY9806556.1 hypothetical protein [Lentilactobacillus senioris]